MTDSSCPKCGKIIDGVTKLCPYCGEILPELMQNTLKSEWKRKRIGYIQKHWRGELSLRVSFWVNFVILGKIFYYIDENLYIPQESPLLLARLGLLWVIFLFSIFHPWQLIGLWRSSNRQIALKKGTREANLVKALIIITSVFILGNAASGWDLYKQSFNLGVLSKDNYGDYKVNLENNGTFIHLKGGMGIGVTKEVEILLEENPKVKGVILDSYGGWVFEGKKLAGLIKEKYLDTYSIKECQSACTIAFIAGDNRYLGLGANLGFHKYCTVGAAGICERDEDDLRSFKRAGVREWFLNKVFVATGEDMWFPTLTELLDANVVHGVLNPSEIIPATISSKDKESILNALEGGIYRVIRKHDPNKYEYLAGKLNDLIKRGGSPAELEATIRNFLLPLAFSKFNTISNETIINFARLYIDSAQQLLKSNPFTCMQYIYPKEYGAVNIYSHVSTETNDKIAKLMEQLIIEGYENNKIPIDIESAEMWMSGNMPKLEKYAPYFNLADLNSAEDYKMHCDFTIQTYSLILNEDKEVAGNILRFVFSLLT